MNDANDGDDILVGDMAIDHHIGQRDCDSDMPPKGGARGAAIGMNGQTLVKSFKRCSIFGGDVVSRLARKIVDNRSGVGLSQ